MRQPNSRNLIRGLLNWASERPARRFKPWEYKSDPWRQWESDIQARNLSHLIGGAANIFLGSEDPRAAQAYYPIVKPIFRGLSWLGLDPWSNVSSNIRKSLWSSYPGIPSRRFGRDIERELIGRSLSPRGFHTRYSKKLTVPELSRLLRASSETGLGLLNPRQLSQVAGAAVALQEQYGGNVLENYQRLLKTFGGSKKMQKYFRPGNLENLIRMKQLGI